MTPPRRAVPPALCSKGSACLPTTPGSHGRVVHGEWGAPSRSPSRMRARRARTRDRCHADRWRTSATTDARVAADAPRIGRLT